MYFFDMAKLEQEEKDSKRKYDILNFVASLQGHVNKETPRLYINLIADSDLYWLKKLSNEGSFLHGQEVEEIEKFEQLVELFAEDVKGLVLWDEAVPATANAAATICGVEGYIPVRYDDSPHSIYTQLTQHPPYFQAAKNLTGKFTGQGTIPDSRTPSTGSAKCDAYIWAKEQYLDRGLCHDSLMAYMLDGYTWKEGTICYGDLDNTLLANHDYFIMKKAFFFELSPWGDETPNDDKDQPLGTDLYTMKEILLSQYRRNEGRKMTSIGGFTPWHVKYTDHGNDHCKHGGVDTEWMYAEILSAYNAMMDADAPGLTGMANASIFSKFPLQAKYLQNRPAEQKALEQKTYILYYMGDYDSAAWLSRQTQRVWDDPCRGTLPLAWAFNPNLSDRSPHVFDYVYSTRTANDYFISGDSGAGYVNPLYLLEPRKHSRLPQAMDVWIEHNQKYFEKFDLGITGFIINGHTNINEEVQKAYAVFSKDGVANQTQKPVRPIVDGVVFHPHTADISVLDSDMEEAARTIYRNTAEGKPQFHIYRSVLCTPEYIYNLTQKIQQEHPEHAYEVVDPYTFFRLLKAHVETSGQE